MQPINTHHAALPFFPSERLVLTYGAPSIYAINIEVQPAVIIVGEASLDHAFVPETSVLGRCKSLNPHIRILQVENARIFVSCLNLAHIIPCRKNTTVRVTSRHELLDEAVYDNTYGKAVLQVTELAFVSGNIPSPPGIQPFLNWFFEVTSLQ